MRNPRPAGPRVLDLQQAREGENHSPKADGPLPLDAVSLFAPGGDAVEAGAQDG